MAKRQVAHGLVEWYDDGARRLAYYRDVVDLPPAEADRLDGLGATVALADELSVFATAAVEPVEVWAEPAPEAGPVDAGISVSRPAQAAAKQAWVDFAVAEGFDRAEVESMPKAEIVELFRVSPES